MGLSLKFLVGLLTPRGLDKAKEPTKNLRFEIYAYEGQDLWHTRYVFNVNCDGRVMLATHKVRLDTNETNLVKFFV
jgi:hypothetical protein